MNGREDQYTFSVPYVDNSQVFVVAEDAGIETKADLAGKAVEYRRIPPRWQPWKGMKRRWPIPLRR